MHALNVIIFYQQMENTEEKNQLDLLIPIQHTECLLKCNSFWNESYVLELFVVFFDKTLYFQYSMKCMPANSSGNDC